MKNLRKAVAAALALMLVFALAACQANPTSNAASEGKEFIYVSTSEVATLNYLVSNKTVDSEAYAQFVDPLVMVNKFSVYEPGMALSWTPSDDGLKWTFDIRKNIKWQKWDGTEYGPNVTAQDWVDSMEYILDPNLASFSVDILLQFVAGSQEYYEAKTAGGNPDFSTVGVKAIDEYTLEYTTYEPCAFFPSVVTYSCFLPINKQFVDEIGGIENFGTDKDKILYYGGFLFSNWEKDQERSYVKNDKYYQANRIHIPKVTVLMVQDLKVALEMFKRGEVSSASIVADQYDGAMADPELAPYVYRTTPTSSSWYYYFNAASPNENTRVAAMNESFRAAIWASINRTSILKLSTKNDPDYLKRNTMSVWGLAADENGRDYMTYGRLPEIEKEDLYKPETVPGLLDQAKAELGATVTWPVTINLSVQNTDSSIATGEVIKQMIEEACGGDVLVEFKTFAAEDYYKVQEEGDFDLTSAGWAPDYADPSTYLDINLTNGYIGGRSGFASVPEWVTFSEMLNEAKSKSVLSERYALMAEAESYMIDHSLILAYRATGGNYAVNMIQNPYDTLAGVPYGMCNTMFIDRIYGDKPLTIEERAAQKEAFEKERAALASK